MPGEVEQRILGATIALIERDGLEGVGIREIAQEAGVNSAAISYYFRSKDNLLRLAMDQTLDQAFGQILPELEKLCESGMPLRVAFEALMTEYLFNAVQYPRITYAHLRDALVSQTYDSASVKRVQGLLAKLADRLAPEYPARTRKQLRLALAQLWSSIFLWVMAPDLYGPLLELDLRKREHCALWVSQMLCLLDGPAPRSRPRR